MNRGRGWTAAIVALLVASPAAASPAPSSAKSATEQAAGEAAVTPGDRALAIGAAIVPGALIHGSGHWVLGQKRTGYRLLAVEGVGIGTALAGVVPIGLTGASRYLVGVGAALSVTGMGLFSMSALADLYGVSVPLEHRGEVQLSAPSFEAQFGYRHVYDPVFSYRNFVVHGMDVRHGGWRLSPSAWNALDDRNARWRVAGAWRFFGPRPGGEVTKSASHLELEAGWTRHAFLTEGFHTRTLELTLAGRWDLRELDPMLAGAFWDLSAGLGFHTIDFGLRGVGNETSELLLMRFGFGAFIGQGNRRGGEVTAYYDHRHDDYAAGMKITGLGSGVAGHIGFSGKVYLTRSWGLLADVQGGSAWLGGVSIVYRGDR